MLGLILAKHWLDELTIAIAAYRYMLWHLEITP
jgi:hypothetical protein